MRIGFITQEYPPELIGGAGTYAYCLINGLADLGHDVVVFTPLIAGKPNNFLSSDRIKIIPIAIPHVPFSMIFYWLKLKSCIKKEESTRNFDIIHLNGPTFWLPGRRISKAPQVLTIHHVSRDKTEEWTSENNSILSAFNGEKSLLVRFLESRCVHSSDGIIAVSDYTKDMLESRYANVIKRIATIHEAPGTPPTNCPGTLEKWKKRLGIGSEKILLFVGRLNDPRKGLDILLTALSTHPLVPNYVLLIVGKGDPEPVKKMAQRLGLVDKIKLMGFIDAEKLWELYYLCDLYIVPSRLEGFGLTILDAEAVGKKVVATRVGAIPEISGPGVVLVEPNDPKSLAEGIHKALFEDGPSPQLIKTHASYFSWSRVARNTEAYYGHILSTAMGEIEGI